MFLCCACKNLGHEKIVNVKVNFSYGKHLNPLTALKKVTQKVERSQNEYNNER